MAPMQITDLSVMEGLSMVARMSKLRIYSQVRAIVYCTVNNTLPVGILHSEKKKRASIPQVRSHGDLAVSMIFQMRL